MPRKTRVQRNIAWIEKYCLVPSGPDRGQRVKLTRHQRDIIRAIYGRDETVSVGAPLSAYLALLHVCGPEAVRPWPTPPANNADIFTVWNATGPDLREVLKRDGASVVCPELGTKFPATAA
jgi:hypothetical protein